MSHATGTTLGNQARAMLLAFSVALAGILAIAGWLGWGQWQRYEEALDQITPRVARMLGVIEAHPDLVSALDAARATVARYAYPAQTEAARVASEFQTRVREIFQSAGLSIAGSQQLPTRGGVGFEEIVLSLSLQGDLARLRIALAALRTVSPYVRIEQIRLQPTDLRPGADQAESQQLNIQMRVVVIRLQGA